MSKIKNLQLLQVLRGIASLLVVLYHATENCRMNTGTDFLSGFFAFGGSGVDMFFVLSGFIITFTSFSNISDSKNLLPFLKRRFVRIYPTYWIIITGFLLLQILLPSFYKTQYSLDGANLAGTYLLFPDHIMINGVSWTLTNELFFYFLFTIAFIVRNKKLLLALLSVYTLTLLALYITGSNPQGDNQWANLFIFPMNIEFFLGIFAALLAGTVAKRFSLPLIITGAVLFLLGGILQNKGYLLYHNGLNRVVYYGFPSFLIILGVAAYELKSKVLQVNKWILSLGDASYSLYLIHLPVVAASSKVIAMAGIRNIYLIHLALALVVVATCYFSILFFRYIESPLIRRLNRKKKILAVN